MFYLVTPPDVTDWHVTREEISALLGRDWPGAVLEDEDRNSPEARTTSWVMDIDGAGLEASLDGAGQALYLDGSLSAVAEFAAWWRRQVPRNQALVLCDEAYSVVIALDDESSPPMLLSLLS